MSANKMFAKDKRARETDEVENEATDEETFVCKSGSSSSEV